MTELLVERGGMCATIQDLGRCGYRAWGVAVGGAIDRQSARAANLLVGNPPNSPLVEITWHGTAVEWSAPTLVAVCGADLRGTVRGDPFPLDRPVIVPPKVLLQFRGSQRGNFAYLAMAGGLEVPRVLGGHGTHLQAGFGGWQGRALQAGDRIPIGTLGVLNRAIAEVLEVHEGTAGLRYGDWGAGRSFDHWQAADLPLRVLRGCHFEWLTAASRGEFFTEYFRLTPECNRIGYRLDGPSLKYSSECQLASLPTIPGTIQLPPGGSPIVLMADAAPTGGYPQIGYVISADIPRLAQVRIGQRLTFQEVTWEEARQAAASTEQDLDRLALAIGWRLARRGTRSL